MNKVAISEITAPQSKEVSKNGRTWTATWCHVTLDGGLNQVKMLVNGKGTRLRQMMAAGETVEGVVTPPLALASPIVLADGQEITRKKFFVPTGLSVEQVVTSEGLRLAATIEEDEIPAAAREEVNAEA